MKNANTKRGSAKSRAKSLTTWAAGIMLAASLLFIGLLTGCPQKIEDLKPAKVTITVKGDTGVTINEPKTFEVEKGIKWNEVKLKVNISYKDGCEAAGFKLDSKNGTDLYDNYAFNTNKTVFVLSKPIPQEEKITLTVKGDEGYQIKGDSGFEVKKGLKWNEIKARAQEKVSLKDGYTALGWKLISAEGAYINDEDIFSESKVIFAVSRLNSSPEPQKIKLTITGDEGVNLVPENIITADKNTKWQDIKDAAKNKIIIKENYELLEWRLNDKTGEIIDNTSIFTKDTKIFALTKKKGAPSFITITVDGDEGYNIKTPPYFEVKAGLKWKNIKTLAAVKAELKDTHTAIGWKLGSKDGADLDEEYVFNGNSKVFAVSKPKGAPTPKKITITIKGDEGVNLVPENTITADKNAKWKNLKEPAKNKLTIKENYELLEWRLNDKTGEVLTDEKIFNDNVTVFAITRKEKIIITVTGDEHASPLMPNTFEADKGCKWEDIKSQAEAKIKFDLYYQIKEWQADGKVLKAQTVFTENKTVLAVSKGKEFEVKFSQPQHGSLNAEFNGVPFISGTKLHYGEIISFKAEPNEGYRIKKWTGTDHEYSLEKNETLTVRGNTNVSVEFEDSSIPLPKYAVSFNVKNGWGGDIKAKRIDGTEFTSGTELPQGSVVIITTIPDAGREVEEWRHDGEKVNGTNLSYELTVRYETEISVAFKKTVYTVNFKTEGERGSLKAALDGTNYTQCPIKTEYGKIISFTAEPEFGYKIKGWRGTDGGSNTEKNAQYTVKADAEIVVEFEAKQTPAQITHIVPLGAADSTGNYLHLKNTQIILYGEYIDTPSFDPASVNLKVMSKSGKEYGRLGERKKITSNKMEVEYTFPSVQEFDALENLKVRAEYGNTVLEEFFLPARLIEEENIICLKRWYKDSALANLKLPSYVEKIGNGAFYGCTGLTGTIVFPASLKTIDYGAFEGCTKLEGADFSACTQLTSINSSAFKGCTGLVDLKLPQSLTTIGNSAFGDCPIETLTINSDIKGSIVQTLIQETSVKQNLKTLNLGEGVTTIENRAFEGCTKLEGADFSACTQLTSINFSAFKGCTGLVDLKLPKSLTTIANEAFKDCISLADLKLPKKLTSIGSSAFGNCTSLTGTIVFPASLKTIDYGAFEGCTKLEGADFSACTQLTTIGEKAFNNCTSLADLKLTQSLNTIGNSAFEGCTKLEGADFSACTQLTTIDEKAFNNCTSLADLKLTQSLNTIGNSAFEGCTKLEGADFSACTQLTTIGEKAFNNCTSLADLKLTQSLNTIGNSAFKGCTKLEGADFSVCTQLTSINSSAFKGCTGLTDLKLPKNLTSIGSNAFDNCTGLTGTIVFPASLKTIGYRAFSECTKLEGADFSVCTQLTSINSSAFKGCTGLTDLKLPQSLTTIGNSAFGDCPIETLTINSDIKDSILQNLTRVDSVKRNLKTLKLGEGVTTIENRAFEGCTKLEGADFSVCTQLTSINSSAFKGCTGLTDLKLPKNLTSIGSNAFENCTGLTGTIVFPASLKTIDYRAFERCTKLEGADFSVCTQLTSINSSAFKGCTGLVDLKLPQSLTTIENSAFGDCPIETLTINSDIKDSILQNLTRVDSVKRNLKTLKLGEGVTTIENRAFEGCTKLEGADFSVCTQLTSINSSAFKGCTGLTDLKLPKNLTSIGSNAFGNCTGLTGTIVFPASLKTINTRTFEGCTKLEGADFSVCTQLTQIGWKAFNGCTSLTGLKLPKNLTSIANEAFKDCTSLTDLKLPKNITKIYSLAFEGCTKLTSAIFADKEGWKVYNGIDYNGLLYTISSSDLADASKAAKYLREPTNNGGYCDKYWKKN